MKEKLTIIIIILFTIIVLVIAWFWLQNVIEEFDVDRAMTENIVDETKVIIKSSTEISL